jgi:cytochrome c oxidase subunit 4
MTDPENAGVTEQNVPLGHRVPRSVLASVFIALLLLTLLTYAATGIDLGGLNVWVAITIATLKAALVALFFMHLAYERPFNAVVLVTTLCFGALFIGLALLDVFHYRENIETYRAQNPQMVAPQLETKPSSGPAQP